MTASPADLLIRWHDGSEQPLTPELGEALRLVVKVMGDGCRFLEFGPTRPMVEHRPHWMRDRDPQK